MDKNAVAKAMDLRVFDTALPQNWVDDVKKVTGAKDIVFHFVWCYDVWDDEDNLHMSISGYPVAISARGARILDHYVTWWHR